MLRAVSVKNFRNLNIPKLELSPGCTILLGGNGQGKTNILEAIYFLSYGKSFRGPTAQAINWREEEARIFGLTDSSRIEVIIRKNKENRIHINDKPKNLPSLLGHFVSVVFHPQAIEIVFGPPALRRTWLDRLIATIDKKYLYALINYQRALLNKNKLLKTAAFKAVEVEVWNKNLSFYGTIIWKVRERTVAALNQALKPLAVRLIGRQVFLEYENPLFGKDEKVGAGFYLKSLLSQQELERRFMATLFGPHRDDFKIIAEEESEKNILQKDLADFGSRAEQRQAALLLKFSEARLFTEFFGKTPTLLLDDIASELDPQNRQLLLKNLPAGQIIITTTNPGSLPESIRSKSETLTVEKGMVEPC